MAWERLPGSSNLVHLIRFAITSDKRPRRRSFSAFSQKPCAFQPLFLGLRIMFNIKAVIVLLSFCFLCPSHRAVEIFSFLQLSQTLANLIQSNPEKFFAEIYLVYSHGEQLLMEFIFQCRSVIGFDHCMNIKLKWHACTA